jgi:uncharacterized membrane protein
MWLIEELPDARFPYEGRQIVGIEQPVEIPLELMRAELLVLRLTHIISGIIWLGSGAFSAFLLMPALSKSPAIMGQVMAGLERRRMFHVLLIIATLTILSGMGLLWIDSAGFEGAYFASGTGRMFGASALAAIVAYVLSFRVARHAGVHASAVASSLAASVQPAERERLTAELNGLRRRSAIATMLAVGFGLLAASGMAIARYV